MHHPSPAKESPVPHLAEDTKSEDALTQMLSTAINCHPESNLAVCVVMKFVPPLNHFWVLQLTSGDAGVCIAWGAMSAPASTHVGDAVASNAPFILPQ